MDHIFRKMRSVALLIAAVLAFGTTGFVVISRYPLFDAFYMALITITTVGYFEVHELDRAGRMFNSLLLLFGTGTMLYAVGALTQTIVENQFGDLLAQRRMKKMIANQKDHYILCGFGRVGRGAADELVRSKVPFVVMDRNEERVERAIKSGMLAVLADSTNDDMLREVGIERARGLIAALATDSDNLFLILSAKSLNPKLKVASRVSEMASENKMRRAGADAVFMPYTVTGYRLAQSVLRPHVAEFLDVAGSAAGMNVGVEQVEVCAESALVGKSLSELQFRRELGVIVLAIRRQDGHMQFNPPAEELIRAGDCLIVMGRAGDVARLENLTRGGSAS